MKVAFAGTPAFAREALAAIIEAGFDVPLVLTQPDRPAGRGQRLQASPVKELALAHGLPVHQPANLRDADNVAPLAACAADVLVVAAYGLILPQAVLDLPPGGCINIHASLLPRWRGAAPIHRAIEAGDKETGITLMRMEAGLDTGPMLLREALPIEATDNTTRLHDRLARLGARMIVEALPRLASLTATPQPADGVTYAGKITKQEAALDFRDAAAVLARRIRAFDPFPGSVAVLDDLSIKIWHAVDEAGVGLPGTVLHAAADGIVVACGKGALRLLEVQKPGGRRLPCADFLAGTPLAAGSRFSVPG